MRFYSLLGALLGWFAVLAQYWLITRQAGIIAGSITYFGFFTIWGNLLVAAAFAARLLPAGPVAGFFLRPGVRSAIGVYILVVAVIFYWLLRKLYLPTGLDWFVNILLHDVMPILYLLDWALFVPKRQLRFAQIAYWLILPLVYAAATLAYGAYSRYYPYPFLDAGQYGYRQIAINVVALGAFFAVLSAGFVAAGRLQPDAGPTVRR